jgi:hypothetical protein
MSVAEKKKSNSVNIAGAGAGKETHEQKHVRHSSKSMPIKTRRPRPAAPTPDVLSSACSALTSLKELLLAEAVLSVRVAGVALLSCHALPWSP